jgi:hypothetical protein
MKKIFVFFFVALFIFTLVPIQLVSAQIVNATIKSIEFDGESYIIRGHAEINDANKGGLPERDTVIVFLDVLGDKGGTYPIIPDTYSIAAGKYISGGKPLTDQEVNGVNCKTYSLWKWNAEVNAWQKGASEVNGAFHYDANKVPSHYENDFEVKIDKKFMDSQVRLRVHLEHIIGGPFANWPGFIFKHKILYQGVLKKISGVDAGSNAEAKAKAEKNASEENPNSLANAAKKGDDGRKKAGMHIFNSHEKPLNNALAQKYRDRINQIIKKQKDIAVTFKDKYGHEKTIIIHSKENKNNVSFWDKLKYYGAKLIGLGADKVPGVKYVSNKVTDKAITASGLEKVKQTQIELGVDKTSADLYNQLSVIPEREKKYATVINIIKKLPSPVATPLVSSIEGAGKSVKKLIAISYEKEYKAAIKRIKDNGGNINVVRKDIEDDGRITNVRITNKYSKGDFKDPVKRFDFYVQLAKKRGDL